MSKTLSKNGNKSLRWHAARLKGVVHKKGVKPVKKPKKRVQKKRAAKRATLRS